MPGVVITVKHLHASTPAAHPLHVSPSFPLSIHVRTYLYCYIFILLHAAGADRLFQSAATLPPPLLPAVVSTEVRRAAVAR